jgi:hypothetical protein
LTSESWAETAQGTFLKDIEINHLTVSSTVPAPYGITVCVDFGDYTNSSTVKNCTFSDAVYGIRDILSNEGNRYINVNFDITVDIRLELGPNGNDLSTVMKSHRRFHSIQVKSHQPQASDAPQSQSVRLCFCSFESCERGFACRLPPLERRHLVQESIIATTLFAVVCSGSRK